MASTKENMEESTSEELNQAQSKNLIDMLIEGSKKVDDIAGKDIVLFLGYTKAGKSTMITHLMGVDMVQKIQNGSIARVPDPKQLRTKNMRLPRLGHGAPSETVYPEVFAAADSTWLCDSPGLFENRGNVDIDVAMSINMELAVK